MSEQTMKIEHVTTSGFTLIYFVWKQMKCKAWVAINHCMAKSLYLAIGAQLHFVASDLEAIDAQMRSGYWLGEHRWEYPYAFAITVGNQSFIEAFEEYTQRKPFFANNVTPGVDHHGYLHSMSARQRERLALGSQVGSWLCKVTSIQQDHVVLTSYEDAQKSGRKVQKLTREQLAELYPAPRRQKEGGKK